jgi:ABC-type uncharacterized transport system auxiliary subunit
LARPLIVATLLLGTACASKLARSPQSFTLNPPPVRAVPAAGATTIVALHPADTDATYGGASLVYRVGEHTIERDPYASFAAAPTSMLSIAIRGYLKNTDFVRDVVYPGEDVRVSVEIEPALAELYGDFTNEAQPEAVMSIFFRVLVPPSGNAPSREILLKRYTERRPIEKRTAASVVAAMNQDLEAIMPQFLADLKAALPPPKPAGSSGPG